jgi:hypothetical protein
MPPSTSARRGRSRRAQEPRWANYADEDLLKVRVKDLKVSIEGTWLQACLDDTHAELRARGLRVRSHAWLSDEWFSPHDTPGIAFPFYLAHPRLARLERKMLYEVEGGTRRECMRILRHEAGHVIQRAFGLHRRKRWRDLFGQSSQPYPVHYTPNPTSKDYVQHLRRWYAQCHPDEDFAETFAVWLTPRSNWRKRYADWPALEKLEYVDALMTEFVGVDPLPKRRFEVDPIKASTQTLAEHYEEKVKRFSVDAPHVLDRELRKIFAADARGGPMAATFVKRARGDIRRSVSRWTGEYQLTLDHAIDDLADRCRVLKLRAAGSERKMRLELTALLVSKSVTTMYSSSRHQSFAV